MHVISLKPIIDFIRQHPTAKSSLDSWYDIVKKNKFSNIHELKMTFSSADVVKNKKGDSLTIFNIHGNEVRLIAIIHYNTGKLRITHVLTHAEYDKEKWKT